MCSTGFHNESSVEIHEYATDTAGATETVFAMFHLFGYRLIPRIRNLGSRRLFVIDPMADYASLGSLIGGQRQYGGIEQHWDEVLRLAASIGSGLVPPSVILKKIAASPRQNGLAQALREIGRIERSIFICDWLLDPMLRRRSHAILLASCETASPKLTYRASGLNLVVNGIILWNTVYLSRAVGFVRGQDVAIPDDLLAQVAPLPWSRPHRRLSLERD